MSTTTAQKPATRQNVQPVNNSSNYNSLDRLRRNEDLVDTTFTIHRWDGTTKVQKLNKAFVFNERGKVRSTNEILMDLNAIVHDDGASHFTI